MVGTGTHRPDSRLRPGARTATSLSEKLVLKMLYYVVKTKKRKSLFKWPLSVASAAFCNFRQPFQLNSVGVKIHGPGTG